MEEGRKFYVYSVKDELTGVLHAPMFIQTDEEALRWFKFVINTTEMWKYNAAMYSLYKLGTFDERKGLDDYNVMEMIAGGLSVLDKE